METSKVNEVYTLSEPLSHTHTRVNETRANWQRGVFEVQCSKRTLMTTIGSSQHMTYFHHHHHHHHHHHIVTSLLQIKWLVVVVTFSQNQSLTQG